VTAAIAVELPPTDLPSSYAEALLESCDIGMQQRATCVSGQDAGTEPGNLAVAIVSWKGSDHLEARIEVGLRAGGAAKWQARAVAFSPGDLEIERWRTLGFAIATVVKRAIEEAPDGSGDRPASSAPAEVPPAVAPVAGEPMAADRDIWRGTWVTAQLVLQSGAPRRAPALGGEIHLEHAFRGERWLLEGGIGCTTQSLEVDHISILRPRVSLGGGVIVLKLGDRARVGAHLAVALEVVRASGQDPVSGRSDSGAHWVGGLEQGADLTWMGSRTIGAVVAAGVREATGTTEILAHSVEVARVPALEWAGSVGFRVAFP
jgi:hypothetical protein